MAMKRNKNDIKLKELNKTTSENTNYEIKIFYTTKKQKHQQFFLINTKENFKNYFKLLVLQLKIIYAFVTINCLNIIKTGNIFCDLSNKKLLT